MKLRKAIDIFRLYTISPECTVIAVVVALLIIHPAVLDIIGNEVVRQDSIVQYIALVPLGLLGVVFSLSKEMLRPSDGANNRVLYEWPDYWRLKYRSLGGVFFCIAASCVSLATWIFKAQMGPRIIGAGLLCSVLVALVATLTQYLAYLRVREILNGGQ